MNAEQQSLYTVNGEGVCTFGGIFDRQKLDQMLITADVLREQGIPVDLKW